MSTKFNDPKPVIFKECIITRKFDMQITGPYLESTWPAEAGSRSPTPVCVAAGAGAGGGGADALKAEVLP